MPVCTWDSIRKSKAVELSNDNLTAYIPGLTSPVFGTVNRNKGKHYFEITQISGGNAVSVGIADEKCMPDTNDFGNDARQYYGHDAVKYPGGSSYGDVWGNGDCVGVAVDMDNGTIEFLKNGVSQGIAFSDIKDMGVTFYPFVIYGSSYLEPGTVTANFGATPFRYPLEGFLPWAGDSEEPVEPSDEALLRVTMIDSSEREYKLPMAETALWIGMIVKLEQALPFMCLLK